MYQGSLLSQIQYQACKFKSLRSTVNNVFPGAKMTFSYANLQFQENLPVKERLCTLAMKPIDKIKLKVMSITMPRINLLERKNKINMRSSKPQNSVQSFISRLDLTASSQCCNASFRAIASFDKPFPTCKG